MRNLCALLFVLLLCSLQLVSSAPLARSPNCCPSVTDKKIPLKKVVSYKHTDSDCAVKGIIFKTVAGKKFCVNPDAVWVSSHVTAVDTRRNTTAKTTTTTPTMFSV
ncbi:monocyte chemotactic protein 1B-like [Electrophorus electricus]|uniref:monocyte chemotactic protein 1B-like n=1 Tax=Electrophorus electricus TaxID=8005 RepID=UPI0015CFDD2E|nr:monocyte chemotactic protein 1B-like [Electrophorus electricus]